MGYDKNRLFVCPKTRMHSQDMNELEKVLAHLTASSDKLRKLRRLREKQLCLAKWAIDGMWYRARIFKVHECRTKVTVQFIDYLNFETVDESDLKDLPSGCFSYPIKHFPATCGSTVNLMNEGMLMEAVKGYKLFARIKEFSEEGVPEIQIYDEYTEKLLF